MTDGSTARSRSSPARAAAWAAPRRSSSRAKARAGRRGRRRRSRRNDDRRRGAGGRRRRHVRARRRRRVGRLPGDGRGRGRHLRRAARAVQQRRHLPRRRRRRARHARRTTWHRVMAINLEGVWLGCRPGIPAMLASGGGSIINVASFVALMGAATAQIAYTASKGGVLAMTREIAVEYARQGIRANALCPGPIETPLLEELLSDPARPRPAHGAHPDGPPRPRRGARQGRAVPRLRRLVVHDRRRARRRRRHHRRLRHARVALLRRCTGMTTVPGMLTAAELHERDPNGDVDTVSSCFPTCRAGSSASGSPGTSSPTDAGGREPVHACNYLLAVDVDMTPLPGYRFANWEQGYGDVAVPPDLATLRTIPWLDTDGARDLRPLRRRDGRAGRGLAPPHPAAPGRARRRRSASR